MEELLEVSLDGKTHKTHIQPTHAVHFSLDLTKDNLVNKSISEICIEDTNIFSVLFEFNFIENLLVNF